MIRWVAMLLSVAVMGWSQEPGTLSGKVTNLQGQGIRGAEIRLRNSTGLVQSTRAAEDGAFIFLKLTPGNYLVEIESEGFSKSSLRAIEVGGAATAPVELVFEDEASVPAGTSGQVRVEVRASSPTVQADSAEVSRAYETRTVRSLPLIDRQNQELISLMPGVTPPVLIEDRILDPQRGRLFNINGLPNYANAYFQDGAYQNENHSGRQSRIAPNASVQQLNVRTSNYNAEHGFAGGGWMNTVTRPGTNTVHGSLFGLHTNRFLTTRNPVNFAGSDPGFNVNQYGGSLGGPLKTDKTFWFVAYEAYVRRGSLFQVTTVPGAELRSGNFGGVPGFMVFDPNSGTATGMNRIPFPANRIPAAFLSQPAQRILAELPLANLSGTANNLAGGTLLREDQHRMDGKIDHRFSEKSTGFFRYGFTQGDVERGSLLGNLGDGAQAGLRNHNAVASLTQSFSTLLAAEFRVGYSRYRNAISPLAQTAELDEDLRRFGFREGMPQVTIAGFGSYGFPANYPTKAINNTFDAATNWNWHNGMHHLKMGAQAIEIRADGFETGAFSQRGSFFFSPGATASTANTRFNPALNSLAGFLTGSPTQAGISSFDQTPSSRQMLTSAYVTDTLNLWKNAHLEVGARYDYFSPLRTRDDTGALLFDGTTNQLTRGNGEGERDLNNIAPRVGIVIRPIERMAIRAGYAFQYFPVPFALAGLNRSTLAGQTGLGNGYVTTPFSLPNAGTPALLNVNQPLSVTSSDGQTPYVQTLTFMVQSDLGNGILLDLGYVGNRGRQLPYNRALNAALPGTGAAGLPYASFSRTAALSERGTGLNSNYNSVQVNLTKRFAAGLSLAGAYTFGKALDYGYDQGNPFDTSNNYGPADWDRKHIFVMSHLWQLPFGPGSANFTDGWVANLLGSWQWNGIVRWATGTPYSILADPLVCNCPGVGYLRVAGVDGTTIDGQSSFDATSFSLPAAGSLGGAGRNGFRGPRFFTYDTSLFRRFPVRENFAFELRAEAYNVTNHTNLANPMALLSSPAAGTSTRTVNGALGRQFQLGARLLF